jgi:hypothetical protein
MAILEAVRVEGDWIGGGLGEEVDGLGEELLEDSEIFDCRLARLAASDIEDVSARGLLTSALAIKAGIKSSGITPCSASCSIMTCSVISIFNPWGQPAELISICPNKRIIIF